MATSTVARRAQRTKTVPKPIVGPQPSSFDLDTDVAKLVLRQLVGPRFRATRVEVSERIVSGTVALTMEGASTLSLTVHDVDRLILRSGVLEQPGRKAGPKRFIGMTAEQRAWAKLADVNVSLDGESFRLVRVEKSGDDLNLDFEAEAVALLRDQDRPRRFTRKNYTRAQAVHALARTVGVSFRSPDENVKQQVAKAQKDHTKAAKQSSRSTRDAQKAPGISQGEKVTVKHDSATQRQIRVIENILDVGRQMGASARVMQAALMVATQESDMSESSTNGSHVGVFQQDSSTGSSWRKLGGATRDTRKDAAAFFKVAIDTESSTGGSLSLAELGARTEGYPPGVKEYAPWESEAGKTLRAYLGGSIAVNTANGGLDFGTRSRTYAKSFQFTVGQPGKRETYWDAIQRWADEVRWRAFVERGVLWFASDATLMRQRPLARISEPRAGGTERSVQGVDTIDFTVDTSEKNTAQEASVTAWTGRWQVPAGCVVEVTQHGLADGRWLVWTFERGLFSKQATVTLRRPQNPKKEPAHETATSTDSPGAITGKLANSKVAKALTAAVQISRRNMPYVWGGGHGTIGVPSGSPPGFDCSGYVSAVLNAAGLLDTPLTSGALEAWGEPGAGKYLTVYANAQHVFIKVTIPGIDVTYIDTSTQAGGANGPHIRYGQRSTAGFTARHWPGL